MNLNDYIGKRLTLSKETDGVSHYGFIPNQTYRVIGATKMLLKIETDEKDFTAWIYWGSFKELKPCTCSS